MGIANPNLVGGGVVESPNYPVPGYLVYRKIRYCPVNALYAAVTDYNAAQIYSTV